MLELFQAEWCPYSHRVRQRLTELGVDFVARQVEAEPDDRAVLSFTPEKGPEKEERLDLVAAVRLKDNELQPYKGTLGDANEDGTRQGSKESA